MKSNDLPFRSPNGVAYAQVSLSMGGTDFFVFMIIKFLDALSSFWIPEVIFKTPLLTWFQKSLWTLIRHWQSKDGCALSNQELADKMGTSSSAIANQIGKLRRLGFITDISFDGRTRTVKATFPNDWEVK